MKVTLFILIAFMTSLWVSCTHDKFDLPTIPSAEERFQPHKAEYVLTVPLDAANGYQFMEPSDVYVGADNFVYVANTGMNRIEMLDAGGSLQGYSQYIPHPEAITQNDSLKLLIVNKTNVIYEIDLHKYNHEIWNAPVDTAFYKASQQSWQYTGISVYNKFNYYVTVIDVNDSSMINHTQSISIYDFNGNNTEKGPLPLHKDGTGLYTALVPTGIVSMRERYLDVSSQETTPAFMFCQRGKTSLLTNNFKVQSVTTTIIEGAVVLIPNTSFIGSDLYNLNKFYYPEDITVDRAGFIFVVDKGAYKMDGTGALVADTTQPLPGFYRFSSTGTQLQSVLSPTQFRMPKGIAVLPNETLQVVYVADTGNNRILMFRLSTQF